MSTHTTTATIVRFRRELALGALFGVVALTLNIVGLNQSSTIIRALAGPVVFASVIFLPASRSIAAIIIFAGSIFFPHPEMLNTFRIVTFALLLVPMVRANKQLPLFYAVVIFWLVFLISAPYYATDSKLIEQFDTRLIVLSFILETFGVLTVRLLSCTKTATSIFKLNPVEISSRSFFVQLITFTVLLTSLFVGATIVIVADSSFSEIAASLGRYKTQTGVLVATLLLLPMLVGLILSQMLTDFFRLMASASKTDQFILRTMPEPASIIEFKVALQLICDALNQLGSEVRRATNQAKEHTLSTETRERELSEREVSAFNLLHLMDQAPWGCLALGANGTIIRANKAFCETMNISNSLVAGENFNVIDNSHPWSSEICSILDWACKEHKSLIGHDSFRFFSSTVEQYYLQLEVHTIFASEVGLKFADGVPMDASTDVAVTLFLRKVPDLREFKKSLFSTKKRDILGQYAIGVCEDAQDSAKKIKDSVKEISTLLSQSTDSLSNTRLMLQGIDELAESIITKTTGTSLPAISTEEESINLTALIQHGIDHLYELMALGQRIAIRDGSAELTPQQKTLLYVAGKTLPPAPAIEVKANYDEIHKLVAFLLGMMKSILPRAKKVDLAMATEQIGTGTANILPTSSPGEYVRIEINHGGKSITPNMTMRSLVELSTADQAPSETEMGIALLTLQVKRLGGFLTVQSSSTKGTQITIYIPLDCEQHRTQQRINKLAQKTTSPLKQSLKTKKQLLLIGEDGDDITTLTRMLMHLGYAVSVDVPETYLDKSRARVSSQDGELDLSDSNGTQLSKEELYDLVVFNMTKSFPDHTSVLNQVKRIMPDAGTIILSEGSFSFPGMEEHYLLVKPYELDDLKNILTQALARTRAKF